MYGIMTGDKKLVLCHGFGGNSYILKLWARNGKPVMRESALEIDQLMQGFMAASGHYNLMVFKFTEEQEQLILISKLRGY